VAAVTHLFTLGWLTTTIFGALCQLLPVALGAPVRSTRVAHAAFWVFAPGVAVFVAALETGAMALRVSGVLLVGSGILLAIGNFGATLLAARARDVTWSALALALSFLGATLVLGLVLLHNLHTGFIGAARIVVLATHLHLALVGWVLVTIVGVSHRLLPMFLLSHGAETRWTKRALVLLSVGVATLAVGLVAAGDALTWAAGVLLLGGLIAFLAQARAFHRARIRRRLDVGMQFAATALVFLAVAGLLGVAVLVAGAAHGRLATAYIAVGLLGGIVLYVVGFFYKIVPLLAWTGHYRGRMGKEAVPTVAQTFSARLATVQLWLMASAVALIAVGIGGGDPVVVRIGASLFLAGVLVFAWQIGGVALGRAAPAPAAPGPAAANPPGGAE
jgi:hypothetical protein